MVTIDPMKPENYRPITLLSCLGKVFTCILNKRLETFADEVNLLKENQSGVRKNYSTLDHILTLHFYQISCCRERKSYFVPLSILSKHLTLYGEMAYGP